MVKIKVVLAIIEWRQKAKCNFAELDVKAVVPTNDEAHWRLRPDRVLFHTEMEEKNHCTTLKLPLFVGFSSASQADTVK